MGGNALLLAGTVLLMACTGASREPVRSSPAETAPVPSASTATVTITQVRYGGPFFTEGSISYLALRQGEQVVFRSSFRNTPMFQPLVDRQPMQPGRYRLTSYQRPCDGVAGHLTHRELAAPPTSSSLETRG